ncbi:SDR family NAD(P)-dependent oxidoreductase [Actinokineospora sp. NBRC 105648]|uniref:SDR family NAD(P)-dependent oxidoreductase n=1 Tax=Actinokineospora sp. NBRC 105648 TaxID=3032206 RepID=UPI0024A4C617|nr:SDR family NAD(P)-dependent oxidoreductase [Actinokineospora sp. NBRC 105648]GLZ38118.1 short-chain dehydrogenase [Actinokineospora sp. NBRC 105648]
MGGTAVRTATTALVTGANKGIGLQAVRQLAELGLTVLLGSRDPDRGARAAAELAARGVRAEPVTLDVTDAGSVRAAAEHIDDRHGVLDVLVNNAGIFLGPLSLDTTAEDLRPLYETNVFGVVTVTRAMLPLLRRSRAPRVVNVSSTTASVELTRRPEPIPGDPTRRLAYASSKAALNMLTAQYAEAFERDPELARIKVNAVAPGFTATDLNGFTGTRTAAEGARVITRLATLPDDGPSGGFFDDRGPLPW